MGDWKGNKNINLKCARPKKNFCKHADCNADQECYNLLATSLCVNLAVNHDETVRTTYASCAKFMLNDQLCLFGDTQAGFQIDSDLMALSANEETTERESRGQSQRGLEESV